MRATLSRLSTDYGMIFVLVILCVFFSLVTYKKQYAEGAPAGSEAARRAVAEREPGIRVGIFTGKSRGDVELATAAEQVITDSSAELAINVQGDPVAVREALERFTSADKPDAIIVSRSVSGFTLIQNLASEFPVLADCRVITPQPYYWPDFLKSSNIRAVANRIAVIAIIAIGMTLVIITAGIDLSVGSLIAFSAVLATLLIRQQGAVEATTFTMVSCSLIAILACAAAGAVNGAMVTAFRIPAFIATLSMMQIARGSAFILSQSESIFQLPPSFQWLGTSALVGIPTPVLLMLVLYILAHLMMVHTVLGRYIYAVGGNPEAARLSGVPVRRVILFCYIVCGALAGLGGVIRASELKSAAAIYGKEAELEVIAAVVVGGTSLAGGEGKIFGTLIGALIIGVIRNGMNLLSIEPNVQTVVLGVMILAAVLLDTLKKQGVSWTSWFNR